MQLGIHVNDFTWAGGSPAIASTLASIAQRVETAGFSTLSVMDHFFQIHGPPENDMLEAYTTLGFVAAKTRKLKIGTVVTGVTYRHPGLLVKNVTTLDVLSGGRAFFGVGAAWFEGEHLGLGVPFPALKERFERLEEALKIAHQMWSGDETPFNGTYYQLARPMCHPMPLQQPHPTIVIGGSGERKTLKLVAQYADACNIFERIGPDELRRKLEVLREHCDAVGRPYNSIVKGVNGRLLVTRDGRAGSESPAAVIDRFGKLRELGFTWVNVSIPNASEPGAFDLIGSDIIPAIQKL